MHIFLFLLLFFQDALAQDCSNPRGAVQLFLDYQQKHTKDLSKAAQCFEGDVEAKKLAAKHLKQVLDAKGYFINFADFSTEQDYVDPQNQLEMVAIHTKLPQITIIKKDGQWIFPSSNFQAIDKVYRETFSDSLSLVLNQLPDWSKTPLLFHIEPWQLIYFVLLLLFSWGIGHIVDKILIHQIFLENHI